MENQVRIKQNVYFNTTQESAHVVADYEEKARRQDDEILHIFRTLKDLEFASYEIEKVLEKYPRSSVVRSINTLTKKGFIEKTGHKIMGNYGRHVNTWKYRSN
jgi:predicted transcriptional regulator